MDGHAFVKILLLWILKSKDKLDFMLSLSNLPKTFTSFLFFISHTCASLFACHLRQRDQHNNNCELIEPKSSNLIFFNFFFIFLHLQLIIEHLISTRVLSIERLVLPTRHTQEQDNEATAGFGWCYPCVIRHLPKQFYFF